MAPRAKARALVVLVLLDAAEPRRAVELGHRAALILRLVMVTSAAARRGLTMKWFIGIDLQQNECGKNRKNVYFPIPLFLPRPYFAIFYIFCDFCLNAHHLDSADLCRGGVGASKKGYKLALDYGTVFEMAA